MKKVTPNGSLIKQLREQLEKGSLQKEMAHEVRLSERMLRLVENQNKPVSISTLERMAAYLSVPRDHIAYAIDTPKLVSSAGPAIEKITYDWEKDRIIPRFDKDLAYATMDEGRLYNDAKYSHDLTVQIEVQFTDETGEYAEELIRLLTPLTWSKRDWLAKPTAADEIALRRRIRQLLVLLKGNDVWVYYTQHMRHLPERFGLPPEGETQEMQQRVAILFGPPGEYGEESMRVDVDNGQPYFLKGRSSRKMEAE